MDYDSSAYEKFFPENEDEAFDCAMAYGSDNDVRRDKDGHAD